MVAIFKSSVEHTARMLLAGLKYSDHHATGA